MDTDMIRTERLEVVNSVPPSRERRDKAISAVCGEVFVGLESKKIELKARLDAAKKKMADVGYQLAKANSAFQKSALGFFKEDVDELKALAKKFKWGALKFEATIRDEYDAELSVVDAGENSYRGLKIHRKVKPTAEILQLTKEKTDISKHICDISMELATVENNIARMPSWKMMVDSAVAKHDLQEDPAGKELYDSVRASFGRMLPAELRSLLPAA